MTMPNDRAPSRRRFLGHAVGAGSGLLLGPLLTGCGGGGSAGELAEPRDAALAFRGHGPGGALDAEALAWNRTLPRILRQLRAPRFPRREFLITDFGAVAGDRVDDTVVVANTRAIARTWRCAG